MKRHSLPPRENWAQIVESTGLSYHSHDEGPYWDESACYEFDRAQITELEKAARTMHQMCREAAGEAIAQGWWHRLGIPERAGELITSSWDRDEPSLYGRFDVIYDGKSPPKLLEYNADTPTSLVEASVTQWFWLQDQRPNADQFNSIHEKLLEAWRAWSGKHVHFGCVKNHPEDEQTVLYLRDVSLQAGVQSLPLFMEDIGWDTSRGVFIDLQDRPIEHCFKLYPWEWMWDEEFGTRLGLGTTRWVEPPWKLVLSSKGLLPVLWELFPQSPYLLPAYADQRRADVNHVRKPLFSREGANVRWVENAQVVFETPGTYGDEGYVHQTLCPPPKFDGCHPVLGLWIVADQPAGMGIREDRALVTGNLSRFVPHYFN